MRFLVDLESESPGVVHGTVAREGRPPAPFSGWLDLIHHLEERADPINTQEEKES